MNLRRAAALALVGWYLMVPPIYDTPDGDVMIGLGKPLHDWVISRTYDSAQECNAFFLRPRGGLQDKDNVFLFPTAGLNSTDGPLVAQLLGGHARCIATDDPRLKEEK